MQYGIVLGAVGLFGLSLLLAGVRRSYRRGSTARQGLKESRSETAESRRETAAVSKDRDDLIEQRDTARADDASKLSNGTAPQGPPLSEGNDRWSRLRDLRRRLAPAQTAGQSDAPASPPASEVPARASDPALAAVSPASDMPVGVSAPAE